MKGKKLLLILLEIYSPVVTNPSQKLSVWTDLSKNERIKAQSKKKNGETSLPVFTLLRQNEGSNFYNPSTNKLQPRWMDIIPREK